MKKVALAVHANKKFDLDPLNQLNGLDYIHVDVADGKFTQVRNLDLNVFEIIRKKSNIPIIAHMMVYDPVRYLDKVVEFIEFFIFHFEVNENLEEIIKEIKNRKVKVGIAINPDTPISDVVPFLEKIDLILVMSVFPGKSGQKFIPESLKKVEEVMLYKQKFDFLIDVDGGVNLKNAKLLRADILSSTSTILNSENPNKTIELLKKN